MEKLLPDICRIQYGFAFDSAKFSDSVGTPLIRIRDVVRGYSETYTTEQCGDEYVVQDGDMLIGMDGEFNIAHWKGGKAYLNQRVCRLIPTDKINSLYLFYFMPQALKAIEDKTPFVTVKHLSAKELNKVSVPIPSMAEQEKIATSLQKVDELISLRKQQLQKLDELVKARFVELFGDPVTNPMEWELHRFDSLCENLDYRRQPITASEREAGIYPYYGASGVVDYVADYLFDEDILLISEDGANLLMRSTPIAFSVSGKVWVNNHAHVVKFEKMSMQKYIEVFFSLIDVSDHITGSAQPKLNQAKLNAMMFPVPSDERLDAFLQFVEQTDKSKLTVQQSLDKLELLKKALMQKYFG